MSTSHGQINFALVASFGRLLFHSVHVIFIARDMNWHVPARFISVLCTITLKGGIFLLVFFFVS